MKILVIEPDVNAQSVLVEALVHHDVIVATSAEEAVGCANNTEFDCVVMELSLGGHSGMEFLYEFRTYIDWQTVPVVVYTSVRVEESVLKSRGWQQIGVQKYLYKPQVDLETFVRTVESV